MMPENAIYYQLAYGAIIALLAGYALSLRWRRREIARRRDRQRGGVP